MTAQRSSTLKICCITATAIVTVTTIILVTLAFTVFKPRDPDVVLYPVGLSKIRLTDFITNDSVTSDMVMSIRNMNYASFEFRNATSHIKYDGKLRELTASVKYNGEDVGEVPLVDTVVPKRSNVNLTTSVILRLNKLTGDGTAVFKELAGGGLNLTCSVTVVGKIRVGPVWPRVSGSVYVECLNSVFFNHNASAEDLSFFWGRSSCWTKAKVL
ncbi:hypothetical protein LINPERHAP1_LOCUS37222 [Linum perenne]